MAVFVRHGHDRLHSHDTDIDTSLTQNGVAEAEEVGRTLYRRFGAPAEIRTSPFMRCRQTAFALAAYARRKYGQEIRVVVDETLCRFTDAHRARVRGDTAQFDVLLESKRRFIARVQRLASRAVDRYLTSGAPVWFVTHAIVVKHAARAHRIRSPKLIDSCAWVDLVTGQHKW